jgi:hypothetical protein
MQGAAAVGQTASLHGSNAAAVGRGAQGEQETMEWSICLVFSMEAQLW